MDMQHFYVLVALGVLVTLAASASLVSALRPRNRWPYRVDDALFSPEQRMFHDVLARAVGDDYLIFAKIRAADIIAINRRLDRRRRERAEERAAEHIFDFVICTRDTTAIVCAVVLAPRSRLSFQTRGGRLDRICAAAGLPLVRIRERDVYSVVEVEDAVFAAMRRPNPARNGSDVAAREAEPLLRGLADAIVGERRGPRPGTADAITPKPGSMPGRQREFQPAAARTDPRISVDADLDLGPDVALPSLRHEAPLDAQRARGPRI
jgi:hypothetical protein